MSNKEQKELEEQLEETYGRKLNDDELENISGGSLPDQDPNSEQDGIDAEWEMRHPYVPKYS